MAGQPFSIREYGWIQCGEPEQVSPDRVILSEEDFSYFKQAITSEDDPTTEAFLQLCTREGKETLQIQNFAGVLQTPTGTVIEILPKIFTRDGGMGDVGYARAVLLKMLTHFRDLPFKKSHPALLAQGDMPILEVFLGYFLSLVTRLVKVGIRSDYVTREDNLPYLKGKLGIKEHIRKNAIHRERFYVHHDEFLPDRAENRLIKSCLQFVSGRLTDFTNQKICREHTFTFFDIPPSSNYQRDFTLCRSDRNMAHYQEVMRWCAMLLRGQSPTPRPGEHDCVSILFPMEKVFESYVAAGLKRQFPEWDIREQVESEYLVLSHDNRRLFGLRPDLLIRKEGRMIVADSKWKLLSPEETNYGISQSDMYQVYAYGHKYLRDEAEKEVILIYPRTQTFDSPLKTFEFEDGFQLWVLPFDLDMGDLISPIADLPNSITDQQLQISS